MNDFRLNIELYNNVLYIGAEESSGAKYKVEDVNDIAKFIKHYIENYINDKESK